EENMIPCAGFPLCDTALEDACVSALPLVCNVGSLKFARGAQPDLWRLAAINKNRQIGLSFNIFCGTKPELHAPRRHVRQVWRVEHFAAGAEIDSVILTIQEKRAARASVRLAWIANEF